MQRLTILTGALMASVVFTTQALAQDRSTSSMNLSPTGKADAALVFSVQADGVRYSPTWGLDQAWINEQNLRKGINHMGRENVGIGRTAFRTTKALLNDSALTSDQTSYMQQRAKIFDIADPQLPLVFTADQEAGSDSYFVTNRSANVAHWAAAINSHVHWMQLNTQHPIVGISPFNEPDYWTNEEGATTAKHRDVARMLKEDYPRCAAIAMVGGNTLNNDKAAEWYNAGKQYYDWGNTHQLAGSMANYKAYYQLLSADGKVGYNDEMHNVAEAMIGLENGMTVGIWWGFDSRARGEFCDISRHGERLAYADHAANWTAASVYRHDDGRVKAFIGSSERQAYTTTYQLLSADREVYYDGHGPLREYQMTIPGGTGYQKGQTNAERVIDIAWGDDVPPCPVNGTYKIVNRATGTVLTAASGNIAMQKYANLTTQQWAVAPCDPRIGGDYSFHDITSVSNAKLRMNVLNFSTQDGADVIAYDQNAQPSSNEQWYLEYAGDGYYYIRSRETALYLTTASSSSSSGVNVQTNVLQTGNKLKRQQWRFLSPGVTYKTTPPAAPTALLAQEAPASVALSWTASTSADVTGYMVLRTEAGTDQWNVIARNVAAAQYVDNTCRTGREYQYKVRAIDAAQNLSAATEAVDAAPTGEPSMVARWHMDGTLQDETANMMDAALYGTPMFVDDHASGTQALRFMPNQSHYVQLPYEVASSAELTVTMWVKLLSSSAWTRLFDFGNGTDQYLFLTPNNGSVMRFAIKNGADEQQVDCNAKLPVMAWKHVAVTIGRERTTIYIDGEEAAHSTGITIKPSDICPALNYLGRSQFNADPYLAAYLDDVRIYNYALTADQVRTAMDDTANGLSQPAVQATGAPAIHALSGMKRLSPQRGLNIIDGRKVLVE